MKKSLVLGILGLALSTAATFAQGSFEFGNYVPGPGPIGAPIRYSNVAQDVPAGKAGQAVGSGFSATAWFSLNGGTTWTQVSGAGAVAPFNAVDGDEGSGAGYFYGGTPTLVGWTSGSVLMYISAFNTVTIGGYAPGTIVGQSAPFSITPVTTDNPTPPNISGTTYSAFSVAIVPEPSTFALAGLGLASLLIFRRRK